MSRIPDGLFRRRVRATSIGWLLVLLLLVGAMGCITSEFDQGPVHNAIESVREEWTPDRRKGVFDISVTRREGKIVVEGELDSRPAHESLLERLAQVTGEEIVDEVVLLPETEILELSPAVVRNSVGNLRRDPAHVSELVSQVLMGMELTLLKAEGGWYLVQGPDDYLGWIERSSLVVRGKGQEAWRGAAGRLVYQDPWGAVRNRPEADAQPVSDVVMGCVLGGRMGAEAWSEVVLPDGTRGYIESSRVHDRDEWEKAIRLDSESLERTARRFIGVPYLWGGTSPKGFDCSGFTQTVFRWNGLQLDRDASQQAKQGDPVDAGSDFSLLQPGDLVFFGREESGDEPERITHVGLYLGDGIFIHSSGRVRLSSLEPSSPLYDEENTARFVRARRLLQGSASAGAGAAE